MNARVLSICLGIVLVLAAFHNSYAENRRILAFRDVNIPWTLTHGDVVIEKGKYDVLLIKHGIEIYCLKIRQSGKAICMIRNPTEIKYANQDNLYEMMRDPNVPKEAKLRIKRNPENNTTYFLIETGNCRECKFRKFRFKVKSMET